jgi:hypothetical protein
MWLQTAAMVSRVSSAAPLRVCHFTEGKTEREGGLLKVQDKQVTERTENQVSAMCDGAHL